MLTMEIVEKTQSEKPIDEWDILEVRERSQLELLNKFGYNYLETLISGQIYPFDKWSDTLLDLEERRKKVQSRNRSKKPRYYEICSTHPDRDVQKKNECIERLRKYCDAESFEGHFEIGEKGLYHYHFLVKTTKYLRTEQVNACHCWKITCNSVRSLDAYKQYINKAPEDVEGWEDIYS